MKRTPEQIRAYNFNQLQGESLAALAMEFFEFSPTVTKILPATHTGIAPSAQDIVQLCKVIAEGRRRYRKIMPKSKLEPVSAWKPDFEDDVSAKHDFEEA